MMADRQTTGGYTKIANVISADFRLLGQLKAGDKVKFEKVSIQAAQEACSTSGPPAHPAPVSGHVTDTGPVPPGRGHETEDGNYGL